MEDFGTIYVVMPAYNVEKFIGTAFDSLLAQTYPNWKCLCVNDGSKDKTWEIMQSYAEKDSRFLIFNHENQGVTKSRNFLLDKVEGPYLAFMDSDDYLHSQMFEILIKNLIEKQVDLAECTSDRFADSVDKSALNPIDCFHLKTEILPDMGIFLSHKTSYGLWINIWNKLYCWDKVKNIRFSEELSYEDDYFYNSMVHSVIQKKVLIYIPLYFYRKNPDGLCGSVNWEKYQRAGTNRIRLSYEYFVLGNRLPQDKKEAFMSDLAQDAYRMIVRKPLKKGKNRVIFDAAHRVIKSYLEQGIIDKKYLSPKQRFHLWYVEHGFYYPSIFLAKLT